ncbi:MAG: hypothetical protein H7Y18_07820 [Clostridiaceae bacterium]|nr:hypothetical protein [Clostridiaceae bacterium]
MDIRFNCSLKYQKRTEKWEGRVTNIIDYGQHYEVKISSRSGFSIIIGKTNSGNFACIPVFNAGCELASLKDIFWNSERLTKILGKVDGTTVAFALVAIADYINID